MEKAVAKKITKRQTTQMQPGNQFKIDWNKEIDWDLLEELDQQEEGQSIPMQDLPSSAPDLISSPGPVLEGPPPGRLSKIE